LRYFSSNHDVKAGREEKSQNRFTLARIEYNDVCKSEKEIDKPLGAPVK
jgi:hypothetical protein